MFKKTITPRISETNMTGHIGHSVIPVWLEEGYADIIRLFKQDLSEPALIIVNLNMDFLNELFLGKIAEVRTIVKTIGTSSLVLHQEIYQEGKLCVRASTTFVNFDYAIHKPAPIPPAVCDRLRGHMPEG